MLVIKRTASPHLSEESTTERHVSKKTIPNYSLTKAVFPHFSQHLHHPTSLSHLFL